MPSANQEDSLAILRQRELAVEVELRLQLLHEGRCEELPLGCLTSPHAHDDLHRCIQGLAGRAASDLGDETSLQCSELVVSVVQGEGLSLRGEASLDPLLHDAITLLGEHGLHAGHLHQEAPVHIQEEPSLLLHRLQHDLDLSALQVQHLVQGVPCLASIILLTCDFKLHWVGYGYEVWSKAF